MLALYQAPYLALAPLTAQAGVHLESYFAQLQRLALVQRAMTQEVTVASAYAGPAYFLLHYEGPTLLAFLAGIILAWRRRNLPVLILLSLFAPTILMMSVVLPLARYQSPVLPVVAMVSAYGLGALREKWARREGGRARRTAAALLGLLVLLSLHAWWRSHSLFEAHSRHEEALRWARQHGALKVMDTNTSAALASAPLYRLADLIQLPVNPAQAASLIEGAVASGPAVVIIDPQQYIDGVLLTVEQYDRSAAALIARRCLPRWRARHLEGLFFFTCAEHNVNLRQTLRLYHAFRSQPSAIAIYDPRDSLQALIAEPAPPHR
jgi:branched-subunit amino acid transport protein AzlD